MFLGLGVVCAGSGKTGKKYCALTSVDQDPGHVPIPVLMFPGTVRSVSGIKYVFNLFKIKIQWYGSRANGGEHLAR